MSCMTIENILLGKGKTHRQYEHLFDNDIRSVFEIFYKLHSSESLTNFYKYDRYSMLNLIQSI